MKKYVLLILLCGATTMASAQQISLTGYIRSSDMEPLAGASVYASSSKKTTLTDLNGFFKIAATTNDVLSVSSVGYLPVEINLDTIKSLPLQILMEKSLVQLEDVVVSTGYQNIQTARATGSFFKVDEEMIDRSPAFSLLDRLDNITSSLFLDKREKNNDAPIQIRGISSLEKSATKPLIVLDNFPYEGDISDINSADIAAVTILRDAAAAAIWGSRAGNGVIVITSKSAKRNQPTRVNVRAGYTVESEPNLFQLDILSTGDYIDMEIFLFGKGAYNSALNNRSSFPLVSPVVELLAAARSGEISEADAKTQIDRLRQNDIRKEYQEYLYRKGGRSSVNINLSGGGQKHSYMLSGGFDRNISNLYGNQNDRFTLKFDNNIYLTNKLTARISLMYTKTFTDANSPGGYKSFGLSGGRAIYPYQKFMDDDGNTIPISTTYRKAYTDTAGGGKLLPWTYNPIDELRNLNNTSNAQNIIVNGNLSYQLIASLRAEVQYQYSTTNLENNRIENLENYTTRYLINRFAQISGDDISYPVPYGGLLTKTFSDNRGIALRGQLNFRHVFYGIHDFQTIFGAEVRDNKSNNFGDRVYGYDENLNSSGVMYLTSLPVRPNGNSVIPPYISLKETLDRNTSIYGNLNYMYRNKLSGSASVRKDASNLFGVNANLRGVPLWSVGGAWILSGEDFYNLKWLPFLKARASYGYSGNVTKAYVAVPTITMRPASDQLVTHLPFAYVNNYPNPDLRWEKVGIFNFGIDFQISRDKLSGSVEYFRKKSTDLVETKTLDPTLGKGWLITNSADMSGWGWDVVINSRNYKTTAFEWKTNFLLSTAKNKVLKLLDDTFSTDNYYNDGMSFSRAVEGLSPFAVVSYKWGGLDQAGNPVIFINGEKSIDYNSLRTIPIEDQMIHGSGMPTVFGSLMNVFAYKHFELSFNISYQLGYYFRRPALRYSTLFQNIDAVSEYADRWQKPGDERITQVPSMIYPNPSTNRDNAYIYSEATVENGSHIRFNDVRLSYNLPLKQWNIRNISSVQFYLYAGNLNILLWKKNRKGLDPQFPGTLKTPQNITTGVSIQF